MHLKVKAAVAAVCALAAAAGLAPAAPAQSGPEVAAQPLNVAHRGASGTRPEHTFPAYDRAIELGADYIEQDLQVTKDGVLVVLHDTTLNRTVRGDAENCTGPVDQKTLAQIKTCDAGSWFGAEYAGAKVPTLEEVFQRYGHTVNYYIETKAPDPEDHMEEKLLELLDQYDLRASAKSEWQVLIQSFSAASLQTIHALDPELPLVFLGNPSLADIPAVAEYAVGIGPSYSRIDRAFVDTAHSNCLDVHPYTVNTEAAMQSLLDLGVDGMFTNFPERLNALLGDRQAQGRQGARDARAAWLACKARNASGDVGGTVPPALSLTVGEAAAFGAFLPGVAKDYTTSVTAKVLSTAGDAALTVSDPSATATGHLVNGTFALPRPLQATATSALGTPAGPFAPVGGSADPTELLSYGGPVTNDAVTVSLKQAIGATDALRAGDYAKTLVFTLSTTTP